MELLSSPFIYWAVFYGEEVLINYIDLRRELQGIYSNF